MLGLAVVIAVVSAVVTCCGEACPATAAEDAKPSAQIPSRASIASPTGRDRGSVIPTPRLIGVGRASPRLSAGEEEELTPELTALVSAPTVARLRTIAKVDEPSSRNGCMWGRPNPKSPTARGSFECRGSYVERRSRPRALPCQSRLGPVFSARLPCAETSAVRRRRRRCRESKFRPPDRQDHPHLRGR